MTQPKQFCAPLLAWTLTLADTCKIASDFLEVSSNQSLVREKVIPASADKLAVFVIYLFFCPKYPSLPHYLVWTDLPNWGQPPKEYVLLNSALPNAQC